MYNNVGRGTHRTPDKREMNRQVTLHTYLLSG